MEEVIMVENYVDDQCVRHLHLMSNIPLTPNPSPDGRGEITLENGVFHLRANYPYRGILDIQGKGWPKFRRVVVWNLEGCENMRHAIFEASEYFSNMFQFTPAYAFMRKLPKGAEDGQDFERLVILENEWVPGRCVAVGGMQRLYG